MKPVVVLVGRPNVGKSTLFNRLTKSRAALVADYPGLTRDRHYGQATLGGREYIIVDTGGFEPDAKSGIFRAMAEQTRQAVAEADIVLFMVDARAGLSGQDQEIGGWLRRLGKPTLLVANKAEGMAGSMHLAEFYELGLGEVIAISASHGHGVRDLLEQALDAVSLAPALRPEPTQVDDAAALDTDTPADEEVAPGPDDVIRLAVAGRPNVGKSTLINTWLGEDRMVVFDEAGTTRDAIAVPFTRDGQAFELIDTAGLRRKRRVFEAIEKFSVVKTLQAIEGAHVVVLMLDATQDVADQDAHIAGYILESGRSVVLAINKWDAVDDYQRELVRRAIAERLGFLQFAQQHFISAEKRQGLRPLWQSIIQAHQAAGRKMSTSRLTRVLHEAVRHQAPKRSGMYRPKLRYAHQGGSNPPRIVIHGNSLNNVTDAYKRYLEGRFRSAFDLVGTPLRLEMKTAANPYDRRRR